MSKRKATKNIDDSTNSDESQSEIPQSRLSIPDRKPSAFSEKRSRISNINELTQVGDLTQIGTQKKNTASSQQRCGLIEKIQCTNFKCHAFIEFEFLPYINFILGRNGSKLILNNENGHFWFLRLSNN